VTPAGRGPDLNYPRVEPGPDAIRRHGAVVPDPFARLAAADDDAVRDWEQAQQALIDQVLSSAPLPAARIEAWLRQRFGAVHSFRPIDTPAGLYFLQDGPGGEQPVLRFQPHGAAARTILDPAPDRLVQSALSPSPEGDLIALALAEPGGDAARLAVLDPVSGQLEPGPRTILPTIAWRPGGGGFFYNQNERFLLGDGASPDRPDGVYWHKAGEAFADDVLIRAHPEGETHVCLPAVSPDGRSLFIRDLHLVSNAGAVLLTPLDPATGSPIGAPIDLMEAEDGTAVLVGQSSTGELVLHLQPRAGGPERFVRFEPDAEEPDLSVTIVTDEAAPFSRPGQTGRSAAALVVEDQLVTVVLNDVRHTIRVYGLDGALRQEIEPPVISSVAGAGGERYGELALAADGRSLIVDLWTFAHRQMAFRLRLEDAAWTPLFPDELDAESLAIKVRQVFYPAKDGVRIPMWLLSKPDAADTGPAPVLLYGYGGWGAAITPEFSYDIPAWLELGGVYAIANIRGGGEYGAAWHAAGAGRNKQTVFDDFMAAAAYLIEEGCTKKDRLAIRGVSNGGLLTGACLTQAPHLFGAVIAEAPLLDVLPIGGDDWSRAIARELGDAVGNPDDFAAMHAYSPLQAVRENAAYPPTFILCPELDAPLIIGGARKFAAALQARAKPGEVFLFRSLKGCGHTGWPSAEARRVTAEELAFLLMNLDGGFNVDAFTA